MKYTVEQLEAMSDFEINKLVAIKEGKRPGYYAQATDTYNIELGSGSVAESPELRPHHVIEWVCRDYCNSWADMGVIIERDGISLIKWVNDEDGYEAVLVEYHGHEVVTGDLFSSHKNPLRAAAIVYLLMGD